MCIKERLSRYSKAEGAQRKAFLSAIPKKISGDVLSVSTGIGIWDYILLQNYSSVSITATDIVRCPVSISDQQLIKSIGQWNFVKVKPENKLPFKSNTFNLIYHHDVFEHVLNPYMFLAEQYRLLKPGGTLIFSTPNLLRPMNILKLITGKLIFPLHMETNKKLGDLNHIQEFTEWGVKSYLNEVGFTKINITQCFWGIHPLNIQFSPFPNSHYGKTMSQIISVTCTKPF